MAKQLGRSIYIRIFLTQSNQPILATLNTKTLTMANTAIDATTPDATTPEGKLWRESLTGMRMVDISGDGITEDSDAIKKLVAAWELDNDLISRGIMVIIKGVGVFASRNDRADPFPVRMTSLEFGGETEGTSTFSIALESKGEVKFYPEL